MRYKILLLLVSVLTFGCKEQSNTQAKVKERSAINDKIKVDQDSLEYAKMIRILFDKIQKEEKIDPNFLVKSIPVEGSMYIHLYSYTSPDSSEVLKKTYYKRQNLIIDNIKNGHLEIIKRYLLFANIVDGEEAEGFFDDLEYYQSLNPDSFCVAIDQLVKTEDRKRLRRIEDLIEKCK